MPHPGQPGAPAQGDGVEQQTAFSLEEAARRLGHYKWIEMRVFEALGEWAGAVPEVDVKMSLGVHCYKHAWHAELWHERLPTVGEMGPDALTVPPNDAMVDFVTAMTAPHGREQTIEKLVGVYRVLIPHKIAAYTFHLHNASTIADGPTIRSLRLALRDEMDDWREGEMLIQSLLETEEEVQRAARHQARVETLLVAAGGIAGRGSIGPARPLPVDGAGT